MATTSFLSPKLDSLIKSALAGDVYAQNRLGDLYREGDDVEQNYSEALQWYQRAADQNDANGFNNVGSMYLHGLGTEANAEKAVEYYHQAAACGLPTAQYNLGLCYKLGKGVPVNLSEAGKWLECAAKAGDAYAQNDWGVMLRFGIGVEKDIVDAAYWFLEAIKQNDVTALGNFYEIVEELKPLAKAGQQDVHVYLAFFDAIQRKLSTDRSTWPAWLDGFTVPSTNKTVSEKGAPNE